MAKSTRHGGASFEDVPVRIRRAELGGERSSDGDSSSRSTKVPAKTDDSEKPPPQAPAQTTENPSEALEEETDSSAHLTDGDGQKTTQPRFVKKAATAARKSRVRSVDDDDFDFK